MFTEQPYIPIKVHPLDVARLESYRSVGYTKALRELDINPFELIAIRAMTNVHMRTIARLIPPYVGMPELINKMSAQDDIKTGVVSSGDPRYVTDFLDEQGVGGLDIVQGGAGLIFKARAIRNALKRIGVAPRTAIYVGDEPRDVRAANKLGMVPIGVSWGVAGR